jgi:uncharacterized protein (TIGR02145 family)
LYLVSLKSKTMRTLLTSLFCVLTLSLTAQEAGCTDTSAANYESTATEDDGSCVLCYDLITQTFNFTGSVQTFTVPSGVDSVTVLMSGAQGGYSQYCNNSGYGGSIQANLEVISNSLLYLFIGGSNGYNGGGLYTSNGFGNGGGGGGSSDIRIGFGVSNRVLVAGGGGGCGSSGFTSGNGGFGGGLSGASGGGNWFGTGGSQYDGGIGGTPGWGGTGGNGSLNLGGAGAGAGAGGSGYYGGGGGGTGSGGGGGSSYAVDSLTSNVIHTQGSNSGDGQIIISYYQNNFGCTDQIACNYNEFAYCEDESCIYPESYFDCYGYCLEDTDGDGVCDELEAFGCSDPTASNYDPDATEDNGSCLYTGCTDSVACNYSPEATEDDGSCDYSCCPGPGCCGVGMNWNSEIGECEITNPTDSNLDGCTDLNDLLNLLGAYGICTSVLPDFVTCGDLIEHEGYSYSTVQIGGQCWFAENCRYLPVVSPSSYSSTTDPDYYVYGYEGLDVAAAQATANYATYGVLYNWPAVMTAGICPSGWHVPTDGEFTELVDFLGGESVAGGQMKEAGDDHWDLPNIDASNSSGFNGLPGGSRYAGGFITNGDKGYWWSASVTSPGSSGSLRRRLDSNSGSISRGSYTRNYGFSVRCVKDES